MSAAEPSEPSEDREQAAARVADLLKAHAPPDWEERFPRHELLDAIIDTTPLQMFVMAADIRESTLLMKEAVRFERFAKIMDKFVSAVRSGIGTPGGWFDKFTGDGFLAYWIVPPTPKEAYQQRFVEAAGNLAHTANQLIQLFHSRVLEDFRRNSHNLSDGVGLSIGLDAGPGFLVEIAGELTLVGPPVVGAVRMVTAAAGPKEIVSNVYLGELVLPGSAGYEAARGVWNGMVDRRPAVVARCAGIGDVRAAIMFGCEHTLPIAIRAGGHSLAGFSTCDDGVVIDLSRIHGVEVDP